MTKICRDCGATKPIGDFYTHKAMADGHLNKCKTCVQERVMRHRENNIERIRQYDRFRCQLPHRRALSGRYRAKYPLRSKAQRAVEMAVAAKRLQRQPCIKCGRKALAHHEDYSKPLDVIWLCPKHHAERHRELRAEGRIL